MPGPWNDTTDRQLLLTLITLSAPQLSKYWEQVARIMGEGFTAESVRQHFQKMRKECKAQTGEAGDAATASPAKGTTTPRKPKSATNGTTPGKSTGKRGKGKQTATPEAEDDDESPCKKVKAESVEADGWLL